MPGFTNRFTVSRPRSCRRKNKREVTTKLNTAILITLIICGTIVFITIIALLFAMWVITKGISMQDKR